MQPDQETPAADEFTPGPWIAKGGKVLWRDEQVAECWRHVDGGFMCPNLDEAEANAALIAAAPCMLAALRDCLSVMEAAARNSPCWARKSIEDARAAIAKASAL